MTKQEKVKALVETFLTEGYGKTVEHFRIASIIEEHYGTSAYWQIINSASKELLECGNMIKSVWKVGYQIVPPDEYTTESVRKVSCGARQIDKGMRILENAPVKDMTQDGVQRYNAVRDRASILQASIHGARVEIKMLDSKRRHPLLEAVRV